jgi:hypothetical protein
VAFDKGINVELEDNGVPREDNFPEAVSSFVKPDGTLTLFSESGGFVATYPAGRWVRVYVPGHSRSMVVRNSINE